MESVRESLTPNSQSLSRLRRLGYRGYILRGREPLLNEGVPFVALRALPERFGAAIATPAANVRVEVEHRFVGQFHVAAYQSGIEPERGEYFPDLLMNRETVRMVRKRVEQLIEGSPVLAGRGKMPRQRQSGAPALWVSADKPLAKLLESKRSAHASVSAFETVEGEVRVLRRRLDETFPCLDCVREPAGALMRVAQVQICRHCAAVDIDRIAE